MPPQLLGMAPDQRVVTHHLNGPEEEKEVLGRKGNRALTALAWLSSSIGDLAESEIMTQHEMQEALVRVDEMTRAQSTVPYSTTYTVVVSSFLARLHGTEQQNSTARLVFCAGAFEGATKIKSPPIPMSLEHCCAGHNSASVSQ